MSVVVRNEETKEVIVYTKGADSKMSEVADREPNK